jgi:DNA recombination protein RmuC
VLIATPTTLLALLHSVGYGWQQERVAESAQAISDLGRDLHGRLVKLSTLIATLGKRLNSAVAAYNETVGSYEARVLPSARRFVEHGVVARSHVQPEIEQITVNARTVHVGDAEDEQAAAAADAADRPPALFPEARHLRAAD